MGEKIGDEHAVGQVPTVHADLIRCHMRGNEMGKVDLDAFQKAIDNKRHWTPSMAVFAGFRYNIVENEFG